MLTTRGERRIGIGQGLWESLRREGANEGERVGVRMWLECDPVLRGGCVKANFFVLTRLRRLRDFAHRVDDAQCFYASQRGVCAQGIIGAQR